MKKSLTETYDVSAGELMKWYNTGRTFTDILKALQTSQLVDMSAGDLLSLSESKSWYEIWRDLGVAP